MMLPANMFVSPFQNWLNYPLIYIQRLAQAYFDGTLGVKKNQKEASRLLEQAALGADKDFSMPLHVSFNPFSPALKHAMEELISLHSISQLSKKHRQRKVSLSQNRFQSPKSNTTSPPPPQTSAAPRSSATPPANSGSVSPTAQAPSLSLSTTVSPFTTSTSPHAAASRKPTSRLPIPCSGAALSF